MSDRVRLHRHPHTLAVALVISLCAAMLAVVPLAAPADAAALAVNITRLYDGTAPFEDWSPGDTTTPTPNGIHDPGDDLDGNNGIVRTLDDVRYRVEYSVNPPLPSGSLVLEVELTNGGWKEGWVPGASTCPGGSSFSANRTLWTCNIGVVTGSSGTVAIDMPAVPPATVVDGSQIQAQVRLTEDGDPLTTQTADADVTTVSAAPRYEVTKQRLSDGVVTNNGAGDTGLAARYFVGLHAADPDPRGLSALTDPLTVTDHFGIPGAELSCYTGWYGSLPGRGNKNPTNPDGYTSTGYSTCTQTGDSLDIDFDINWNRTAPPPTHSYYGGALASFGQNLIAWDQVTAWLPIATVDAADGTPGDGQGTLYAPNSVEASVGATPAAGSCSTHTWSPDPGTASTFDPIDIGGASNLGTGVEPVADNGGCARYYLNINTYATKSGSTNGSPVRAGQDFLMYQYLYNTSSTGPALPDRVLCDKFDNSRFTLNDVPTFGSTSGTRWAPTNYTIEYGIGSWGESYPGGPKTNGANAWYVQATSDCSDSTATDLGGGQQWVDSANVDWTNSGGGTVDADRINMIRITIQDQAPAGKYASVPLSFHALDDLTHGEELRNYSAYVVNPSSTWTTSSCTGQNNTAQTCTDDLVPPTYGGAYSRWLQVGGETARVSKSSLGATTLNAGDTNSWRVYAFAYPGAVYPPGGWGGWSGSTDIVLDDILPEHFNYVLGSAQAWDNYGASVPIADPLMIPDTPSAGLTTLRWDLGPVPWNAYVRIDFDTKIDVYADTGAYTNYAEVHSAMDADYPFPAFPSGDTWGRRANRSVDVVALSSAAVSKTSTTPYIVPGEDTIYTLQFGNPGPDDLEWMDAIDILPYDGDTRGSIITADTFTLADVSTSVAGLETWVSDTDPATLSALDTFHDDLLWPADPNVTAPGTPQWPCTFADASAGAPGCPALADVTALRFIGADPNPSASGPGNSFLAAGEGPFDITLTYNTTIDALVGDTYPNSWMAVFEGLSLPVLSPTDVIPTIAPLGVGDLVYIDVDFNGVYDASHDVPVPGVDIELYAEGAIPATDAPVGTATTDASGRWFIGDLFNGNYWAYFPSSNTDPGGPLEGRTPALGSVADPNTDADETTDHNTVNLSGIASGLITIGISEEPIGDGAAAAGYRDVDVNGTLDFAVRGGPAIDVQKTVYTGHTSGADCPGAESATTSSGGDVTWCVTVTNTGDTSLTDITLDDADLGLTTGNFTLLSGNPALMGRGDTATWYVETTETATLDNDVTATGNPSNPFGNDIPGLADVTDTDNATINVVAPAITIDKTVYAGHNSGASCAGGELTTVLANADVTYCLSVTNTGTTHQADVTVDDTDLGVDQSDMTLVSGDPALVAPGGTVTWYYDDTATADLTNTATTTGNPVTSGGTDLTGIADVADTDTAQVAVVAPAIDLQKTVYAGHDSGTSCSGGELVTVTSGADVTYCFTVTNTGDTHLADVDLGDTDLGIDETDATLLAGDPTLVAPGGTVTWYYDDTATSDLTNTAQTSGDPATAGGADLADVADVIDNDTAEVDVVAPSVTIDKTAYAGHDAGASCGGDELVWYTTAADELTYCFEITTTGDTHLSLVTIDDTDLGIDGSDLTLLSGNPILLAPGATTVGYYQTNGTGDLTNTVDLTANPVAPDGTDLTGISDVTDSDTARVDEVAPAITIDKTVYAGHDDGAACTGAELATVTSGDDVTYCFTVTNTGDTHLGGLSFTDPDLGIDDTDVTVLAQDPMPLAPGASGTAYYETTAIADLTNTASTSGNPVTSSGTDMTGITNVTDTDTAQVDVIAPSLEIQKTVYAGHDNGAGCDGDQTVSAVKDTPVSYCFRITNTGTAHLADVTVTDADLGIDQDDMSVVSGDPNHLAPGASVTLVHETTVDGDLVNTATASGTPTDATGVPAAGLTPPTDADTAEVDQVSPAIDLKKKAITPIVPVGDTVEFEITVTNTGDVGLIDVHVSDDLVPACARTIGNLAVGRKVTFTCEVPVGGTPKMLTNVARATADIAPVCSADPCVSDEDKALVEVVESVLMLEKRALQNEVAQGGVATYSFTITNPTRLTIEDVRLIDETFPECSREIGALGALQTVSYTCEVSTPEEAGELVNKAYVSGRMLTRSYTSFASAAIMIVTTLPGAPLIGASGGPLAATGADSTTASSTAALLLVLGVFFLATARRRRQEIERD